MNEPLRFPGDELIAAREQIATLEAHERELHSNIRRMLVMACGAPSACDACGTQVWFLTMRSGKRSPFTEEAVSHFANCPEAGRFRRPSP